MDDFELELKQGFLEEAAQGIADVEQCFLDLENNPNDLETINKIFRLAHNLKGSSRAVGFDYMGEFTHSFESFILKVKNHELAVTPAVINLLLRANDHLREMVATYSQDLTAVVDSSALMHELKNFDGTTVQIADSVASDFNEQNSQNLVNAVESQEEEIDISALNHKSDFLTVVSEVEAIAHETLKSTDPITEVSSNVKSISKEVAIKDTSLRVSLNKVEQLINYVGEMVILQSVLREQLSHIDSMLIRKSISQLGKVSKEIQELSMGLRMIPVKPTFQKMQRIVRDTAQALEKDVVIHLDGEETELDKTVLEKITDPLVHLIRNAVDHGVESIEKRLKKGKPARGNVHLSAYHKSGRLIIKISDDGGGLNPQVLKQKAIEKRIIKPEQVLTDSECYQLIFAPGFSTKEAVTDISGRGVGMDVVRTNISDIGGEITIQSELDQGTTFLISLPLTLAIIDSMVVTYATQKFVMPLSHVHESLKPTANMITNSTELGDIITLRGEPIPLYRLGDFFGLPTPKEQSNLIAMVVRSGSQPFALLVEDILGQNQVVIKQLTPELSHIKGISGLTILGDGKPSFILEPADLIKRKITKSKPLILEAS